MEPMRKLQEYFVPYTTTEVFFETLQKKISSEVDSYVFRQNIERKVWPLLAQTQFFIIEDTYTETEWKDMIAEHYIHTKYDTKPTVVRVHLFNGNQDIEKSYLGCFTLRKINNADMVLSFVYPNWNVLCLEKCNFENSYLITASKRIHIFAEEIEIKTTPYFVQDGMVTSCAHASILMMTHFLNLKYGYKKIRIKDVNQSYLYKEKLFPTRGLLPEQVMEVLTNNGINVVECELGAEKSSEEEKTDIRGKVMAFLRSGIPVMLGIDGHGVLIVGFKEDEDKFIFLDDSGALIHNINNDKYVNNSQEYDSFLACCEWDYIFEFIEDRPDELVQFLIPMHERIYSGYEEVLVRCLILKEDITEIDDDLKVEYSISNERFFIADNAECKKFINMNILDREFAGELLDEFICCEQPHYLWCYEFECEGEIYIIFINTTYNIRSVENNIFINKDCEPFHIAKHFHTVDVIKTIDNMNIPLFDKKGQRNNYLRKRDRKRMGSIKPKDVDQYPPSGPLLKTKENLNNTSEKTDKKGVLLKTNELSYNSTLEKMEERVEGC